jgi:hypothetical protein
MMIAAMLASAETSASSLDLLVLILEAMGVIAGVAIAAAVPLFVMTGRRAVRSGFLAPVCLLWALAVGGYWLYLLFARYQWNVEYQKLVMSGYFDPANTSSEPGASPLLILALAVGYAGLIVAAIRAPARQVEAAAEEGPPVAPESQEAPGSSAPHTTNGHPRE